MMDITEMRVVVERIIPSNVRKLRSLAARSESMASLKDSPSEALERINEPDDSSGLFVPNMSPGFGANPIG